MGHLRRTGQRVPQTRGDTARSSRRGEKGKFGPRPGQPPPAREHLVSDPSRLLLHATVEDHTPVSLASLLRLLAWSPREGTCAFPLVCSRCAR